MKRKFLAIIFCALMTIGVAMFAACDNGTEGLNIEESNGRYYLGKYTGTDTDIIIPAKVDQIPKGSFRDCTITSVTFKNTEGWYVFTKLDGSDKIEVDVTDTTKNATMLTVTYVDYWWDCSYPWEV